VSAPNIIQLETNLTALQTTLKELQRPDSSVTTIQKNRIDFLNAQLKRFQTREIEQREKLAAQEIIRDEALARIQQERDGTRGSAAGCRPEVRNAPNCDEAMADRDDAFRRMRTIQLELNRIANNIKDAETELSEINAAVIQNTENRREDIVAQRKSLEAQIKIIEGQLKTQLPIRENRKDVAGLAKVDPRYNQFNPDLAEQVDAYVDYMGEEANPLEWSRAGFMALIIISLEMGVFALASSRRVNAGEVRGYLADVAKSEEAADLYHQIVENRFAKKQDDTLNSLEMLKKREIMEAHMDIHKQALRQIKENPDMLQAELDQVMNVWESMRMKANDNAPEDSPEAQAQKPKTPGNGPA
jgi:hypothetical protein